MLSFYTAMAKIVRGFVFLCKVQFLLFKPHWHYQS